MMSATDDSRELRLCQSTEGIKGSTHLSLKPRTAPNNPGAEQKLLHSSNFLKKKKKKKSKSELITILNKDVVYSPQSKETAS